MKRRVLALLLSLTMVIPAVPVSAAAKQAVKEQETNEGVLIENKMAVDQGEVESINAYKTGTAAGVAPVLPDSVVANGLVFDTPTESVKSATTGYDFGEEFNARLIPVKWEAVPAASYAADQVGKTFTVKGTATWEEKSYEATAEITVNAPAAAGESNSSVTFENVQLTDEFWAPKQETNAMTSLNKAIEEIEKASGGEPNFDNAIKRLNGEEYEAQQGFVFQDTDIYKSIESLSYTLSDIQDDTSEEVVAQRKKLEEKLNSWIEKIEKVQYADGYIDTFFTLRATGGANKGGEGDGTHRWRYFSNHEMYNAGHFLEAVVAYTRYREGIGSPDYRLYVAGKRFADEIVSLFGPEGTRNEVPGHEEIELALVKFGKLNEQYEGADSSQKYYDTAKIFIDRRGESSSLRDSGYYGGTYSQDGTPFTKEVTAKGHSVRANYFWTGATDVATLLPDGNSDKSAYMNSLSTIWDAVANKKTYITGGIGTTAPSADSEGFGDDYVLPNNQSYCEICAAIAAANWNQRMNLLYEDGKYADMVEKNLYNAILVGTNLEGNKFYYSTLLEAANGNQRSDWFYCACCPPNLMRTLASVSGYMYTVHGDNLFVNMYIGSNGNVTVNGTPVAIKQETNYPWEGAVKVTVNPAESKNFTMKVRIPGWLEEQTKKEVTITVNGKAVTETAENGYVAISRTWKKGDVVMLDIPMEIRKTEADEHVTTNTGKIALQRGPIVYSLEKAGNQQLNSDIENFDPANIVIPRNAKLSATYKKDLLKGVVEITGDANYSLYGELVPIKIQTVPYYAWNNRGDNADYVENGTDNNYSSKMEIWTLADKAQDKTESSMADDAASMATVSSDKIYTGARMDGVKMNWEPEASNSGNGLGWSNWYVEGGTEHWLQYDWDQPITTQEMQFYWFDNHDWDRSPATLIIQYKDADGNWKDATAKLTDDDGVFVNDQYNVVKLDKPITSTSMRLLMAVRTEPSTVGSIGCYRWKVIVDKAGVAANVENLISKIGTVECTTASRKLIYEARNAYDSISDEIKALVSNYADLEAAEKAYNQLCEDAAAPVIAAIDKIGTVTGTKECKALIDAARKAYDALSRPQKARVTNYGTLVAAEELYVDKAAEGMQADKAAALSVDHLIDAIGTVKATKESKAAIDKARAAYNALTDVQKTYVTKLKTLVAAEAKYKELTPEVISITKAKVSTIPVQKYTGKHLTPAVKVSYKGKTLKLKTDYTVSYKSNKEIGTAKVIITGKGKYKGTITKTFKIVVKKNSTYTVGNYKYKITNERTDGKGTVTVTGVKTKSLKSLTVVDTVKIGNKKFKVTVIDKSAFSGCTKVKSAVIGKNVTEMKEKAFYNCKALKNITIQTKSLKKVGKNALKNINKKAVIKVPKSKLKAYQKLFKSAGQAKSVKIK